MKKMKVLILSAVVLILMCGFGYAGAKAIVWEEFYNNAGETVLYPTEAKSASDGAENVIDSEDLKAPESAKIGQIFKSQNGYERVIAVNPDGAYVTEVLNAE